MRKNRIKLLRLKSLFIIDYIGWFLLVHPFKKSYELEKLKRDHREKLENFRIFEKYSK